MLLAENRQFNALKEEKLADLAVVTNCTVQNDSLLLAPFQVSLSNRNMLAVWRAEGSRWKWSNCMRKGTQWWWEPESPNFHHTLYTLSRSKASFHVPSSYRSGSRRIELCLLLSQTNIRKVSPEPCYPGCYSNQIGSLILGSSVEGGHHSWSPSSPGLNSGN